MSDEDEQTPPEVEANGTETVDVGGYTWPSTAERWPARVLAELEQNHAIAALGHLLGDDQMKRWWKTEPTTADANDLIKGYFEAIGLDLGG